MVHVSWPRHAAATDTTGGQHKCQIMNERARRRLVPYAWILVFLTVALVDWIANLTQSLREGSTSGSGTDRPNRRSARNFTHYIPAPIEEYVVKNADSLGFNSRGDNENPPSCGIWHFESLPIHDDLDAYRAELKTYQSLVSNFSIDVADLRRHLDDGGSDGDDFCERLELDQGGLGAVFPSGQLSLTRSGFVEPLLPPMRHPEFCFDRNEANHLMDLGYIVHDFAAMCRKLKKTSRTVLVDMGAEFDFVSTATTTTAQSSSESSSDAPAAYLLNVFNKFGFKFDHIYAYSESTERAPADVFRTVPEKYLPAYHWINVGAAKEPESPMNPLRMIMNNYDEDDLIIVKLDVDNPDVEMALAEQLAAADGGDFGKLIDQFYFEHHMHIQELAKYWMDTMRGNAKASMDLFSTLRRKGIPAHYWV